MSTSSTAAAIACPHCGKRYAMTPAYIEQFGGRETACAKCGNGVRIPRDWAELVPDAVVPARAPAPPVLAYSAPPAQPDPVDGVWRDEGETVVVARGAKLPCRCHVCNSPTDLPPKRLRLIWLSKAQQRRVGATSLLAGGLIGMLVLKASAEYVPVDVYRCREHRVRVDRRVVGLLCVIVAIIAATVLSVMRHPPYFVLPAVFVLLIGGIFVAAWPSRFRVIEYGEGYAWITGFSKAFRKSLPSLGAARKAQNEADARRLAEME